MGVPVVPDSDVQVCNGETTLIFVLLDAEPGVPLPNALKVTSIVIEGPMRRDLQGISALDLISQGDGNEGGDRDIDGARCEVGPVDGQTIQYIGGAYSGAYRCTFEVKDERGIIVLADLFLQVNVCIPKHGGEMPKPQPPAPKPAKPTPKPAPKPAWQPSWQGPSKPSPPTWEGPLFWGWGKSGKSKSSKTPKAFKGGKRKGGNSRSGIFAESWRVGGLQVSTSESNSIFEQKDGTEFSEIHVAPVVEGTKTAAGSRAKGYFMSLIVVIVHVGTFAVL